MNPLHAATDGGKVPPVAQRRILRPGYTVIHPNRDKPVCKLTRVLVALILLLSVALMLTVTIGGWTKLQGMKPINFIWCAIYVVMAIYGLRWARGLLPIAAALAVLLIAIAAIAGFGVGGTSWFDRGHYGYGHAGSLFGGTGLSADAIGTLTLLLIPLEAVLVIAAIVGFAQGWNIELEVPDEEARRRGYSDRGWSTRLNVSR